ncbi:hypothetical protein GGI24_005643 [Coemansia furcata]|nr:hypothetical protein GGI24_005643 [Coemansia furcata]
MSAPLGGQVVSITSSPDNSPPLQQQPQQQHYQQRPMFGGSVSEIPLRATATDVNVNFSPVSAGAGWVAPPVARLLRPSPQSSSQSTVERSRPSTSDLAFGLAQGYFASAQSASLPASRQVSGNMQQGGLRNEQLQQYQMRQAEMQQSEMQRMAERHRYNQQVAMMAQGVAQGVLNQQPQAQYYQPPATQLITPVSGNYEGQLSVDTFNRQMVAGNAQWQTVQYPAGPRGPPMYLERMNGFVSASDMACVLCEDPVHPSSSCPLANNISHLNRRRVAVEESTTLPPNMREMMLITIDNYMKKALNQR